MLKKMICLLLAAVFCVSFSGCSPSAKKYGAVKKAQKEVENLQSGKIIVTAGYEKTNKSDQTITEFTFKITEAGNYEYCQTQFDKTNKAVYCEYSDGEKSEQWLIGKGWGGMGTSTFNKKNPHRYIKLLTNVFENRAIKNVDISNEESNTRYNITLNPDRLNKTVYENSDVEIKSETIGVLINNDGNLVGYSDAANLLDKQANEDCVYTLDMQISQQNSITEIKKPELRDNYQKK